MGRAYFSDYLKIVHVVNSGKVFVHHVRVIVMVAVVVVRIIVRRVLVFGDGLFGTDTRPGANKSRGRACGDKLRRRGGLLRGERPRLLRGWRRNDDGGLSHSSTHFVETKPNRQRGVDRFRFWLDKCVEFARPQVRARRRLQRLARFFVRALVVAVVRVKLCFEVFGEVFGSRLEQGLLGRLLERVARVIWC